MRPIIYHGIGALLSSSVVFLSEKGILGSVAVSSISTAI